MWSLLSTAQHGAGIECCPDSTFSDHCPVFLYGFDYFGLYCRICFCISFIICSIWTVYLNLPQFIFLFCADCVFSLFSIWCSPLWCSYASLSAFFDFLMYLCYTVFVLFISLALIVQALLPYGKVGRVLPYKISTVFFCFSSL